MYRNTWREMAGKGMRFSSQGCQTTQRQAVVQTACFTQQFSIFRSTCGQLGNPPASSLHHVKWLIEVEKEGK
jgi:hypothetical protein